MEQDFNDIALAKFLQSSPELGNFILSFRDVSDDLQEDEDIKVGVFILRSGAEIFYVPVVSKQDNVYPIDSIFIASKGQFYPLTKKTVALVVNANQESPGRGKKIPSTVVTNPDLTTLINPPRTGKYVAASTSRLSDFMAAMPDYLKSFTMEKISAERSVYENLHKLFSIRDIFAALKPAPGGVAAQTNQVPVSIVTGATIDLSGPEIAEILENGYAVRGSVANTRVAVQRQDADLVKFTSIVDIDGNTDYEVVFNDGRIREAYIPKINTLGHFCKNDRSTVALFTNGDYAIADSFVARGSNLNRKTVLDTIFNYNPPVLPRDVDVGETFAMLDMEGQVIGVFQANRVITSNLGVELRVTIMGGFSYGATAIKAYHNYSKVNPMVDGQDIYAPYASLIIKLGKNVTYELEKTVNAASRRQEIVGNSLLDDQINLSYDGVEYSVNGKVVGQEKEAMQRLVVDESIHPSDAKQFVKHAQENKVTRIYLTKKAEAGFRAGEIPQFGNQPTPPGQTGLNGSFIPNVQQSLAVGDSQATEATIISELLQAPDMFQLIDEYLPDIEEALDRLGRILFLSRVHINKLSNNNDVDSVFSFLAQLKAVYRMLGDNVIKLQELLALKPNEKQF